MRAYFFFFFLLLFCSCHSLKKANQVDNRIQQAVATARSYTGTPYRYGGTSKRGMDCSGLLCVSYRSAGYELPRTSSEQGKLGKAVKINELKPGDLVFFSKKKGRRKITHVGMVTEVNSRDQVMFIHSSSSRGVIENNLHSKYYRSVFVKARRPF